MNQFATELTNRITPDYMEKLDISTAPFTDIHNNESYYENDNAADTQKKITHLLEYTNLVLFIQGAKGTGKTAIIKQRLLTPKEDWLTCYFSAKDYVTADTFIEKLTHDFALFPLKASENHANLSIDFVSQKLDALCKTGKLPILIIDDIDKINENIINILSPLIQPTAHSAGNNRPIVRLIIAGEDIPAPLLNIIPEENEEKHLKYLPVLPLSESETGKYLKFRLKSAGYTKANPFTPESIKSIYLEAKGFPHEINQLANDWLSSASDKQKKKPARIDLNANNNKLKLAAMSLAGLVIVFIVSINFSTTTNTPSTEIQNTFSENKILAIPDIQKTNASVTAEPEKTESKNKAETTKSLTTPPLLIEKETNITEKINGKKTPSRTQNWVNKQNPQFFTLQLISATKKSSLEQFIKKYNLSNDAYIFSTTRNNKPWHSVIYQSYNQRSKAQATANTLPKELKQTEPWIRSFSQIKRDMQ